MNCNIHHCTAIIILWRVSEKYRNPSIYFEWIKKLILYLQQTYCNIFIFCMWDEHVFPKIKKGGHFNLLKHLLCWHTKKGVFTRELMTLREYVPTMYIPDNMAVCQFDHLSNFDRLPFRPFNCIKINLSP